MEDLERKLRLLVIDYNRHAYIMCQQQGCGDCEHEIDAHTCNLTKLMDRAFELGIEPEELKVEP